MRILIIFFLMSLSIACCQGAKGKHLKSKKISEKEVPEKIISKLLEKIGLDNLQHSSPAFEIRKWGPFMNDTFPVFMGRIYFNDNLLKAELYYFSSINNAPILSIKALDSIKVEKREIKNIDFSFYDSLKTAYGLFSAKNLDIKRVDYLIRNGIVNHDLPMQYIEQVFTNKYISIFSRYPRSFASHDSGYFYLNRFKTFIDDSIFYKDSLNKKWSDEKMITVLNHFVEKE